MDIRTIHASATASRPWPTASRSDVAIYLAPLDGFRALSILLVVISHCNLQSVVPGGLGVLVFFVISGFLITRQLLSEVDKSGTLSFRGFYMRRFLRLYPALLLFMLVFNGLIIAVGHKVALGSILAGLFYATNYHDVYVETLPYNVNHILWSLAVEEHFFLFFPVMVWLFRDRLTAILPWLLGIVLAVLAWRFVVFGACGESSGGYCGAGRRIYYRTVTIVDCIMYVAITAIVLHYHRAPLMRVVNLPVLFGSIACLFATLLIRDELFRQTIRYSLQSISVALLILNVLYGSWRFPAAVLSFAPLIWVGKLSYSLYLVHFGVMMVMAAFFHSAGVAYPALYAVASTIAASASYYGIERPMLRLRRPFGSHAR